jgi:hypothetical protein
MLRKRPKSDNLFRRSPAMWCPYVVSFARCATGCSASAHIAQRTRSNVTTATRATRSRPQLLLLQSAKPGTQGSHTTIILFGTEYPFMIRATSFKILTCSCFLVSYSSLKHTQTLVDDKPTWGTKFIKYIYLSATLYMFRPLCLHHQERSICTNTTSALVIPF